ncbi:16S rRNA (guanine(966)-N(2))-methyltransferase RsmD [Candidatus Saccharibacteria bacterium]|nr:16S rRNA (guanine(966)-N(2))-methyltransferase RsmD [Candidatus Saccharibacteria bacterium]
MKNSVKITSGIYRGRSILTPGEGTHPMGERERLALFNKISSYLNEATVLDAYAGSGALGIEALSRGALKAVFIEKNANAARIIRENLRTLGAQGEVITDDASKYATEEKFDVILLDPPYDKFVPEDIELLAKNLAKNGIMVLSHPGEAPEITGLELQDSRKYAGATLSFYA